MKITEKRLRFISGLTLLTGAIVSALSDSIGEYVGIGIMIVGLILLIPWVKDKKE